MAGGVADAKAGVKLARQQVGGAETVRDFVTDRLVVRKFVRSHTSAADAHIPPTAVRDTVFASTDEARIADLVDRLDKTVLASARDAAFALLV